MDDKIDIRSLIQSYQTEIDTQRAAASAAFWALDRFGSYATGEISRLTDALEALGAKQDDVHKLEHGVAVLDLLVTMRRLAKTLSDAHRAAVEDAITVSSGGHPAKILESQAFHVMETIQPAVEAAGRIPVHVIAAMVLQLSRVAEAVENTSIPLPDKNETRH